MKRNRESEKDCGEIAASLKDNEGVQAAKRW